MASKTVQYPGIISVPRFTTLLVSLLVTLSSGTNYVYSAYAPQLGARLNISHTHLNIVGSAGNLGVYCSGPIWGRIVDARGPRILMASAFVLLLSGYFGMKLIFDGGLRADSTSGSISFLTFCVLVGCGFMTGAGGNAGLAGAVNSTAKTFPDKARATSTGLVISGFGLSAFLFSTISRIEFAGNTSSFLGLLAFGTATPMIAGFVFVRPVPLPPSSSEEEAAPRIGDHERDEEQPLTLQVDDGNDHDGEHSALLQLDQQGMAEETPIPQQLSRRVALSRGLAPNVYGRKLWTSTDFWLLFCILSILSGTGLMFINNVGVMSQALYIKSVPTESYDPIAAARWQADQVSSISLFNFSGRIFIGIVSDYTKHRLSLPRSSTLVLVAFLFFLSQFLTALVINSISHLWIASATLGLAHGSVFSLLPNVCLEWFGMPHFSENWGYLSLAPIIFGNIFSIIFGRNFDAHAASHLERSTPPLPAAMLETCTLGRECYVDAIYLTLFASFVGIILSVWAGYRDQRKLKGAMLASRRRRRVEGG